MSRERSLLDRLRNPVPESQRTIRQDPRRLQESVLQNLRRLLNSRQNVAPACMGYGLPDMCDMVYNFPGAALDMRKAIKLAIETYEPRLRRVSVKQVESPDDPLLLNYEITGELVLEEGKASVWMQTRIDPAGDVDVKG
jgi:type VI secretion system protein